MKNIILEDETITIDWDAVKESDAPKADAETGPDDVDGGEGKPDTSDSALLGAAPSEPEAPRETSAPQTTTRSLTGGTQGVMQTPIEAWQAELKADLAALGTTSSSLTGSSFSPNDATNSIVPDIFSDRSRSSSTESQGGTTVTGLSHVAQIDLNSLHYSSNYTPGDDLFANQWHLQNTGQFGATPGIDIDVSGAWNDYTGAGVNVGIYDSGVQWSHHDLDDNHDTSLNVIINGTPHDGIATPGIDDPHGTNVAGLIGAENDGVGTVGVAFDASMASVNIFSLSDTDFLQAWSQMNTFDVTNHSWGWTSAFYDNRLVSNSFFDPFFAGLQSAADTGRGNLGTITVHSAGNDRTNEFNSGAARDANDSNFTNSRYVITVGALGIDGHVTHYSTPGACLLVSAPAAGIDGQVGVWTTDFLGADGYNTGSDGTTLDNPYPDYDAVMNGTSAASPIVAGVVALILEANPTLGWRDVQEILAYSARHVGSAVGSAHEGDGATTWELYDWSFNGAHNWNGGGLHFSNDYGFGLVDAYAAVRLAETWTTQATSANEEEISLDYGPGNYPVPDGNTSGINFNFGFLNTPDFQIDHVAVEIDWSTPHTYVGDLIITLTAPDGTTSYLLNREGTAFNSSAFGLSTQLGNWEFTSTQFWGTNSINGNWTVNVADAEGAFTGVISDVRLTFYGDTTNDDTYVYTDEFSDYAGLFSHSAAVSDANGGTDVVNAAAVTSNSLIRLDGGTGRIDGVDLTFLHVENATGGDGHDTLIGNDDANLLYGMRGEDSILGGVGNDTLYGGANGVLLAYSGAGEIVDPAGAGNVSAATALSIDGVFLTAFDPDIEGSNWLPHVSISGTGDGTQRYYSFTVLDANTTMTFDIDYGSDGVSGPGSFDSWISLFDTDGTTQLSYSDDSVRDPGSVSNLDSYLSYTFTAAGTYYIAVGSFSFLSPIPVGGTYELQITTDGNVSQPSELILGGDVLDGGEDDDQLFGEGGNDTLLGGIGNDTLNGGANETLVRYTGAGQIVDPAGNTTAATALSVDGAFATAYDPDIEGSEVLPRVSITGIGDGTQRYYSFTVLDANTTVTFDIDYGSGFGGSFDSWISLFDTDGTTQLAQDDDSPLDPGSTSILDSYLSYTFATAGTYFIAVGAFPNLAAIPAGATYELQITVDGAVAAPSTTTLGGDLLDGGDGDDQLFGEGGHDSLLGGIGNDTLYGGNNNDTLRGNEGNDTLSGDAGNDLLDGGDGTDTAFFLGTTDVTVDLTTTASQSTGYGNDRLVAIENVTSGGGNDSLTGNFAANLLSAGGGNDTLYGGAGNDTLWGSANDDQLSGDTGDDVINGGSGIDTALFAGTANVTVDLNTTGIQATGYGNDRLIDIENVTSGAGNDTLIGNGVANVLNAGGGNDSLIGGAGNDTLYAGAGDDTLSGDAGDDVINGGDGIDTALFAGTTAVTRPPVTVTTGSSPSRT